MQQVIPSAQAGRKRAASEIDNNDVSDTAGVRRRISRACDQCNQLRSKCDGRQPCTHCTENQLVCAYERAHKKRGRVPKKEQTQPAQYELEQKESIKPTISAREEANQNVIAEMTIPISSAGTNGSSALQTHDVQVQMPYTGQPQSTCYKGYATAQHLIQDSPSLVGNPAGSFAPHNTTAIYPLSDATNFGTGDIDMTGYGFPLGDDYSVAFMGRAPVIESPDWLALTTPMFNLDQWPTNLRPPETLRYPVLQHILPQLESIIPQPLACDLLEHYFTAAAWSAQQPKNPYILCSIFRKQSILHPTSPRPCTGALLASMLWISAQHSDASLLTSQPDARARICQKLLELTINMLKPLVHGNTSSTAETSQENTQMDASLGGLVLPIDVIAGKEISRKQVDNIVTYAHLATVVSASERKAASLRWWNAAWSLAREIRLGRELPYEIHQEGARHADSANRDRQRAESFASASSKNEFKAVAQTISEEDREERRRTWWLLYIMDRHLALCYNRPMFFLNKECENLLQPMDDDKFQLGQFEIDDTNQRHRGLDVECTSLSVYGFFLPLMVILGEILDLNHARNRPRLGPGAKRPRNFSDVISEIEEQLGAFEQSLVGLDQRIEASSYKKSVRDIKELKMHTGMVVAYGTHIMHVLHILLTGKWDPIALLDDNDLWISSQSFVNATEHAVSAAKALADIIDYDADLSLMPYFFGIYLLQGSFLLLLFADKLQDNITADVVRACETIVRAHEACVSTLDTQYQRNFRRVMRSALQQLRGRLHEDAMEQQNWRREILKLYRWSGDGTGLAL